MVLYAVFHSMQAQRKWPITRLDMDFNADLCNSADSSSIPIHSSNVHTHWFNAHRIIITIIFSAPRFHGCLHAGFLYTVQCTSVSNVASHVPMRVFLQCGFTWSNALYNNLILLLVSASFTNLTGSMLTPQLQNHTTFNYAPHPHFACSFKFYLTNSFNT